MPANRRKNKIRKPNLDYADSAMSFIAIVGPLTSIPQLTQIYQTKNVEGVSLVTWVFSIFTSVAWIVYGHHRKDKPILFNSYMCAFFCSAIALGIFLYR